MFFIAWKTQPVIIPNATTLVTPNMLHSTCLGFKSVILKLFFVENVLSNVGQKEPVMLVMYSPLSRIGVAQLKALNCIVIHLMDDQKM